MEKQRVMPILAGAVVAVSLTACQGMMGGKETGQQQTSSMPAASSGAAGQQQAMSSDLVRDVQRGLATRGYDVGPQDGVFGDSTQQALRKFQRDQRMNATGQVDGQTLAALGVVGGVGPGSQRAYTPSPAYTPTSKRQGAMAPQQSGAQRVGLSREQVRSVQQNLADRGYDPGPVDSRWGPRTQGALQSFQKDQNIRGSGRPDPQTLAALGVEGGAPATQTGQLPEDNPPDVRRQGLDAPARERGELPPTGSQAPGAAPEVERAPLTPGGAPDTRANPPE